MSISLGPVTRLLPEAQPVRRLSRPAVSAPDKQALLAAALLAVVLGVGGALRTRPDEVFVVALLIPVTAAAGMFLRPRQTWVVYATTALVLLAAVAAGVVSPLPTMGLGLMMVFVLALERAHSAGAVTAQQGVQMLRELRDGMSAKADTRDLPEDWAVDARVLSAHDAPFAGDFLLTERAGDRLSLLLVDVSGNGLPCGARALSLANAFSGILGALPADEVLGAANGFLLRQDWQDTCATAVHVEVDLSTGEYSVGSAGHPAAMHYTCARSRWTGTEGAGGVMMGVVDSEVAGYRRARGRLAPGDALLLYTDGVVENSDGDVEVGTRRMLTAAQRVIRTGGQIGTICAGAAGGEADDRSAVLIRRS